MSAPRDRHTQPLHMVGDRPDSLKSVVSPITIASALPSPSKSKGSINEGLTCLAPDHSRFSPGAGFSGPPSPKDGLVSGTMAASLSSGDPIPTPAYSIDHLPQICVDRAVSALPAKSQFFLPTASRRNVRSEPLLSK